ncbi:MAG: hypothetical protein AMXMBFR82_42500 [Candidatus Hydrogenedentota bacterium]
MNEKDPLLTVRFEGKAVGPGRIPVAHLLRFLENLGKALQRTGRVLTGETDSVRRGPQPRSIKEEVALDLVLLTHGSPSAVLGFERRQIGASLPGVDFGIEILEKAMAGLATAQDSSESMPAGFDTGVLMAWRDAGTLFSQGIERIEFTLNHRERPLTAAYTSTGFARIQERIKGPQTNIRTIEGRLLMADFKVHGTRCRVHPSVGDPVLCLFDEEQKDEVLEDILHYVRVVGEAKEDPVTGKISSIKIHDIERLEEYEGEATELLPQGTPLSLSFWDSPTLDELLQAQDVKPVTDVNTLLGGWPGDSDDGFEEEILRIRHSGVVGD